MFNQVFMGTKMGYGLRCSEIEVSPCSMKAKRPKIANFVWKHVCVASWAFRKEDSQPRQG